MKITSHNIIMRLSTLVINFYSNNEKVMYAIINNKNSILVLELTEINEKKIIQQYYIDKYFYDDVIYITIEYILNNIGEYMSMYSNANLSKYKFKITNKDVLLKIL